MLVRDWGFDPGACALVSLERELTRTKKTRVTNDLYIEPPFVGNFALTGQVKPTTEFGGKFLGRDGD